VHGALDRAQQNLGVNRFLQEINGARRQRPCPQRGVQMARQEYDGWGLIRASNTQPALVLRFEATSPERLATIRTVIEGELTAAKRALVC
jgi:phosphomannomutase